MAKQHGHGQASCSHRHCSPIVFCVLCVLNVVVFLGISLVLGVIGLHSWLYLLKVQKYNLNKLNFGKIPNLFTEKYACKTILFIICLWKYLHIQCRYYP